jgi:hypothetical protein
MDNQTEMTLERRPLGTCGNCFFARLSEIDPNTMKRTRACYFMPPTGVLLPTPQGIVSASIHVPVTDEDFCWQWKANGDVTFAKIGAENSPKLIQN